MRAECGPVEGMDSLISMTQNASVETVTARMYKTERKDFMLRAWQGIPIIVKSVLQ